MSSRIQIGDFFGGISAGLTDQSSTLQRIKFLSRLVSDDRVTIDPESALAISVREYLTGTVWSREIALILSGAINADFAATCWVESIQRNLIRPPAVVQAVGSTPTDTTKDEDILRDLCVDTGRLGV